MSDIDAATNLTNHFLLAMPGMADTNFGGAVVFLAEHSAKGALGLVINRPMELDMKSLFERIDLTLEVDPLSTSAVFYGGPVQTDRGFVLHQPLGAWSSTVIVRDSLGLTSSKDVLEAVAEGTGPQRLLVALAGYGAYVINAGQFIWKLRMARLEGAHSRTAVTA